MRQIVGEKPPQQSANAKMCQKLQFFDIFLLFISPGAPNYEK